MDSVLPDFCPFPPFCVVFKILTSVINKLWPWSFWLAGCPTIGHEGCNLDLGLILTDILQAAVSYPEQYFT